MKHVIDFGMLISNTFAYDNTIRIALYVCLLYQYNITNIIFLFIIIINITNRNMNIGNDHKSECK